MAFPSATPSYAGFTGSHTLSADNHAAQSNQEQADIIALANKVGTGASTPVTQRLLRGNGTGTSAWAQADLTTDVTGVLPVANGGNGTANTTGTGSAVFATSPSLTTPSISNPTVTGGGSWTGSPSLSTPTIADLSNSTHNHQNNAGGGLLNLSSIDTTAWVSWTPTWANFTVGNGTNASVFRQIGKTVYFRLVFTLGNTSVMGSLPTFTLPVTSVASPSAIMPIAWGNMAAAGGNTNGFATWASTTTALLRYWDTNNNLGNVTSTTPGTWTTNDQILLEGFYEAA